MNNKIIPFTRGFVRTYLIKEKGTILVDTGIYLNKDKYIKIFQKVNIDPKSIELIIITHGHSDHFAHVSDLKDLTGAKVLCHEKAVPLLKTGKNQEVKPRNFIGKLEKLLFIKSEIKNYKPIEPDIVVGDNYDLIDFGINGKVIYTPGHTECSISVVLDSKEVIAGDMLNGRPDKPTLSVFVTNEKDLISSINKIIELNSQLIYCGHGGPFKRESVIEMLHDLPI